MLHIDTHRGSSQIKILKVSLSCVCALSEIHTVYAQWAKLSVSFVEDQL